MVNKSWKYHLILMIVGFIFCCHDGFSSSLSSPHTQIQLSTFKTHDDLTIRTGFWPCSSKTPCKGSFVILGGMGGFLELYQETANILTEMGYSVYSFDWRSQGGSSRRSTIDSLLHVEDFDEYLAELNTFVTDIVLKEAKAPLYVMAISMGGHLALRHLQSHPTHFSAAILLAPMIEINTSPCPLSIARHLAKGCVSIGQGERFAPGYHPYDFEGCAKKFKEDRHGDLSRYLFKCIKLSQNPQLATGGPSYHWLKAAFDSCDILTTPSYAQDIKTPCLMAVSGQDHLVNADAQLSLCKQMPRCSVKFYQEGHHNILMDTDDIRHQFWKDFKAYMKTIEKSESDHRLGS